MSVPAYVPGTWTAVACPGFVALLDPSVPAATVRTVWERGAEGVLGALAVLARGGFEGLPSFALVAVRGQRVHVVQRGDVEVVVSSAVGARTLTADGVTTWTEQVLEPATAVSLQVVDGQADDVAAAAAWPLGDGAAAARSVEVNLVAGEQGDEAPTGEAAAPTGTLPAVAAPATAEVPGADGLAADGPGAEVPAARAQAPDAASTGADDPVQTASVEEKTQAVPPADEADESDEPAAEQPVEEPAADRTDVSEEDEQDEDPVPALVPLEPAATEASAPAPAPRTEPVPMISPLAAAPASSPTPMVAPAPVSAPTPVASGPQVTTTSTGTSPTSLPALVAVGAASADDHDGLTILSTDLAAIRERLPSWAADWTGAESVPGPFAAPASTERVPQLVLSTGLVVPLDRAVLLGRAPQVTRVANSELPHLVTVPSPQQDISRTHAEVRFEGGKVTVTDLASTNGVHLTRKGEGARRLHPGEATVVEPGHVVDLGDGVTFTVEHGS